MSKDEKAQFLVLEKYVKTKSKEFTVNDAASVTGLPLLETEEAVKQLMEKYDCKLKVTEGGDLVYDFGRLQRRNTKSFGEYFEDFMQALWRGFMVAYKIAISLFLIVYFIIFLVLVLALVVGVLSGGKDNNNSSKGIGQLLFVVFRIFLSIFEWSTILGYHNTYRRYDRQGYGYRHYTEKQGVLAGEMAKRGKAKTIDSKDQKGFVASIYDFVFGPPRVETDLMLENQREVATYLRENKGLVSIYELQALAGWTREEAENFMTRLLANYDGKAEISPNAVLYGDFTEFTRSKDRTGEAPVIWYWDEYEPEYELTGNKTGRNAGIVAMNSFNLLLSAAVLWGPLGDMFDYEPAIMVVLGWIPLVYSLIFFFIPLVRSLLLLPKHRLRYKANLRKRLMKAIFQEHNAQMSLKRLTQIANEKATTEEKLSEKIVEKTMMDVIYDLGGESFVDNDGEIIYKFERLDQELTEMEQLRKEKRNEGGIGDIIFEA